MHARLEAMQDEIQRMWLHLPDEILDDAARTVASVSCMRLSLRLCLSPPFSPRARPASPQDGPSQPAWDLSGPT